MSMFQPMLRLCSRVKRWGVNHVIHEQSIADHMFYVAHYAMDIAMFIGRQDLIPAVAVHALWHDVDEIITGDINGPAKRQFMSVYEVGLQAELHSIFGPRWGVSNVSPSDQPLIKAICKTADYIDQIMFCSMEISKGNRTHGKPLKEHSFKTFNEWLSQIPVSEQLRLKIAKTVEDRAAAIETKGYARAG